MRSLKVKDVLSIPNPVQAYRMQISKTSDFAKVIYSKKYDIFDDVDLKKILPKGVYWIRLSYIDLLGYEGKYNAPKKLIVR